MSKAMMEEYIKSYNKQEIENEIQFCGMTSTFRNKEDAENIVYRDKSNQAYPVLLKIILNNQGKHHIYVGDEQLSLFY